VSESGRAGFGGFPVSQWNGNDLGPGCDGDGGADGCLRLGADGGRLQVSLQIPAGEGAGGVQVSLTAGGVPVRDANLIVWVK